jgi:hypothetical protein
VERRLRPDLGNLAIDINTSAGALNWNGITATTTGTGEVRVTRGAIPAVPLLGGAVTVTTNGEAAIDKTGGMVWAGGHVATAISATGGAATHSATNVDIKTGPINKYGLAMKTDISLATVPPQ